MGLVEGSGICIATSSSRVNSPVTGHPDALSAEVGRAAPDLSLLAETECRHAHERVEWKARTAPLLGVEVARAGTEHGNRRARSCSTDYITPIRLRMVANCNGDTVPNARVFFNALTANIPRKIVTSENGFFEFRDLRPGMTYQISIS